MGGVCCPTLISNASLAESSRPTFTGFITSLFLDSALPYQTFGNTGDYQLLSLGGVFLHFTLNTLKELHKPVKRVGPICVLEQVAGVEPAPSAWKAEVLAVIRYLHNNQVD